MDSLDAIQIQYRDNSGNCLREVLSHWLKQLNPLPCWKAIVDALRSRVMNEAVLAEVIEKKTHPGMFTMIEVLYYTFPVRADL